MSDPTACDVAVNSLKFTSDPLSNKESDNSSDSEWLPQQRKVSSLKWQRISTLSSGSDCPSTSRQISTSSSGSDCPSASRKHKQIGTPSSGSDCPASRKRKQIITPSSGSDCPASRKRKKISIPSSGRDCPSASRKCKQIRTPSSGSDRPSACRKRKQIRTSSSDSDFPSAVKKKNLNCIQSSGSDCPSASKAVHLNYTQSSGSDCSSSSKKHHLNYTQSSGTNHIYDFKRYKSYPNIPVEKSIAGKASCDIVQMLKQLIRTAYQFTRHSHRDKLTMKDLEKAFKIHHVEMTPEYCSLIDLVDEDLNESGNESQPISCSGMWLRKP